MRALDLKLFRDFRRLWAQALAIALVLAGGIGVLIMTYGAQSALSETRSTYYERNRFAEVFATVSRAPQSLSDEIRQVAGVSRVETRISQFAILDIAGLTEPAMGRLLSLPESGQPVLNLPVVLEGRVPQEARIDEVLVNANFAAANGFSPGDRLFVTMNGQKRELTIVGTALSPEFIYTLGPGALLPDDRRFGILWMSRQVLAAAYDLEGAFNDVTLGLTRGASVDAVIERLDVLLKPYGGAGAFGRDLQVSHGFLDSELTMLGNIAKTVPPIFLLISVFLVNMVLGRLITLEREQIGLLKALGYSTGQIAAHYIKLAVIIGVIGVTVGWVFGFLTSRAMAVLYAQFFQFPFLVFQPRPDTYVLGAIAGLLAVVAGAANSVRKISRLRPAVAMSPPVPTHYSKNVIDRIMEVSGIGQTTRMIVRSITRWPLRAVATLLGVAVSGALMIASLFMLDAMDELLEVSFFQINRQDAIVALTHAMPQSVLQDIENLPGVMRAEGTLTVATRLRLGPRSRLIGVEGRMAGTDLIRLFDADTGAIPSPGKGIVLTSRLAEHLQAKPGDMIDVELLQGRSDRFQLRVTGVITQYFGLGAFMDLGVLNTYLQQAPLINTAHIEMDKSKSDELFKAVKNAPGVAGVTLMSRMRLSFDETLRENTLIVMNIMAFFAAVIVVGVVYNSARIQLSERARELASLRILGFTKGEISYILLGELMFLTLVAIPVGFLLGYGLSYSLISSLSSDLYSIPLVINDDTYLKSGTTIFVAAIVSALLVKRRIHRLDLVAVMKTRE